MKYAIEIIKVISPGDSLRFLYFFILYFTFINEIITNKLDKNANGPNILYIYISTSLIFI